MAEEKFWSLCKLVKLHLMPSKQINQERGTSSEYIMVAVYEW